MVGEVVGTAWVENKWLRRWLGLRGWDCVGAKTNGLGGGWDCLGNKGIGWKSGCNFVHGGEDGSKCGCDLSRRNTSKHTQHPSQHRPLGRTCMKSTFPHTKSESASFSASNSYTSSCPHKPGPSLNHSPHRRHTNPHFHTRYRNPHRFLCIVHARVHVSTNRVRIRVVHRVILAEIDVSTHNINTRVGIVLRIHP